MNSKILLIICITTLFACGAENEDKSERQFDLGSMIGVEKVDRDVQCNEHFIFGLPIYPGKVLTPICHANFYIAYDEIAKIPRYTSHEVTINNALTYVERLDAYKFETDPLINESVQASSIDYIGVFYDKGHMLPWADNSQLEHALESNYFTNITPQVPSFNRGIWLELEKAIRNYVIQSSSDLFIITGAITGDTWIGRNVEVPSGFYKVLYDVHNEKMIAYVIKQHEQLIKPLSEYSMTVDELEVMTGIDFYPLMDVTKQETLESKKQWKL
ncbi:MAG: endonuclease G [Colwellia sp.]|jgi:endonuclease G